MSRGANLQIQAVEQTCTLVSDRAADASQSARIYSNPRAWRGYDQRARDALRKRQASRVTQQLRLSVLRIRWKAVQVDQQVLCPVLNVLLRRRPVHVSADPVAHVLWEALVEFIEISWHDEPVVPDVSPVNNCDWVGRPVFNRKTGEIYVLIPEYLGIALHGGIFLERI